MRDNPVRRRVSRFWLYGPTALLLLLAVGWGIGWFFLSDKAAGIIDAQLAREAQQGRNWSCPGRSIGGFPFRFEVNCNALSFQRGPVSVSLGQAKLVVQAYNPRHVIVEAAGPLQFSDGRISVSGTWKAFEASITGIGSGSFERVSLITKQSSFTVSGLSEIGEASFSADGTELHVRPTPGGAADSFDIALGLSGGTVPLLNVWMGDDQPLQVDVQATLDKALAFIGRPFLEGVENWRSQGGIVKIGKLDTRKGLRIFNLKGEIGLDEMHRIQAAIHASQANYSDLFAQLTSSGGERRALKPLPPEAAKTPVAALPPIYLTGGKVKIAVFDVPKVRLPPLY